MLHKAFYRSRLKKDDTTAMVDCALSASAEAAYQTLKATQVDIGMSRFRMGAILCTLETHDAWQGNTSARSFQRFIAEEGIEPKAAHQYMKVARRFVLELQMTDKQLERIAPASMRALVAAAEVADRDNLEEIISLLATLPRQEAMESLKQVARPDLVIDIPLVKNPPLSAPVKKVLAQFDDMTLTQRAELYAMMRLTLAPTPSPSYEAATMQIPCD